MWYIYFEIAYEIISRTKKRLSKKYDYDDT